RHYAACGAAHGRAAAAGAGDAVRHAAAHGKGRHYPGGGRGGPPQSLRCDRRRAGAVAGGAGAAAGAGGLWRGRVGGVRSSMTRDTLVRWHVWFHWTADRFEDWLEAMAAQGWHLVKTDRWMHRSHFRRGVPKKVRYCVDFPGEVTDEYYTIYRDAGWEMVSSALGWHIWRTEYN